jgi:multidrug efflux system membrane fusion protein
MLAAAIAAVAGGGYLLTHGAAKAAPAAAVPPPAMQVTVATVLERKVTEWDEFSGRLEAVEHVEVRPRVSGTIESVHFSPGAIVAKGATLFRLDARPFAAEVARAQAGLAAAQARLALTRSELARAQRLLDEQAIAQREFEERRDAERNAAAAIQAAQAALDLAQLNLGYTHIKAPIAGRVGRAEITAGNLVSAGASGPALTSIVSISPIYASFEADEQSFLRYAARAGARPGTRGAAALPIQLGLADESGHPRTGRVEFVDNQLDPRSGTIRVRALFDNADGRLTPGLFARLKIGGNGAQPALLISDRAIGTDQSKKFVLVVEAGQQLAYREVKLGPVVNGLRVVREGLASGEVIVVNGLQRVRPGMQVAPVETPMESFAAERGSVAAKALSRPAS